MNPGLSSTLIEIPGISREIARPCRLEVINPIR
jgi:hypothetical protein